MSNTENEMTLSQFFKVAAKSLRKLLIFALTSIITATAALSIIRVCTDTRYASAIITVEEADDNTLNLLSSKKNAALASAVSELYASDTSLQTKILTALSHKTTVTSLSATQADNANDSSSIQFSVNIDEDKSLGLSANQYKALADGVTRNLLKELSSFGTLERSPLSDYDIDSNIANLEYVQVADEVTDLLKRVRSTAKASLSTVLYYNGNAGDFKSNGRSLNEIIASLDAYVESADIIMNSIVSLRLSNPSAAVSAKDYLKNAYDLAIIDAKRYSDYAAQTDKELQYYTELKITLSITDKNNVLVQDFAKIYNEITLRNETAQKNAAAAQKIADVYEMRYNAYKDLTADQLNASTEKDGTPTKLKNLYTSIIGLIDEYNAVVSELENNVYSSYTARATVAKTYTAHLISVKLMLIIDAALLVISMVVAYSQTFEKMKRNGLLNEI